MRIVGFLQVRNEVASGHLQRFLELNSTLFDDLYAIDDASEDETVSVLRSSGALVLENTQSRFQEEASNKEDLLRLIAAREPDGTAILWLDADEVLYCSRDELNDLISKARSQGCDSISFNHLNLWRSDFHHRLDDNYHSLRPTRIWLLSGKLSFRGGPGLHGQTHPFGLVSTLHSKDFPVFHYGFASIDLIVSKYATYFLLWQTGYALDRLIDESTLELEAVDTFPGFLGSRWPGVPAGAVTPERVSPYEWQLLARRARQIALNESKPKVTLICLIFKSVEWLEFAYGEALRLRRDLRRGEVEILFIANDPTDQVVKFLRENAIPHRIFKGRKNDSEWYINSVYRAYNFGVQEASADFVYLINSDMAFVPGSLRNAMVFAAENRLVATRLVESGRLPSGEFGVERDLGSHPRNFRRREFHKLSHLLYRNELVSGGLFMPLLADRLKFLQLGGFPEGNVTPKSLPDYLERGDYVTARQGEPSIPGDQAFMAKAKSQGVQHLTALSSLAYHFQEGELASSSQRPRPSGLLVLNDRITGVNGEITLWNRLVERLEHLGAGAGLSLEGSEGKSKLGIALEPFRLFSRAFARTRRKPVRVLFANASYQIPFPFALKKIALLQDRPKGWALRLLQRISIWQSTQVLTNDLSLIQGRGRRRLTWVEIATNIPAPDGQGSLKASDGREPSLGSSARIKSGVFVGAFNETKGESLLSELILRYPEVHWTLISKLEKDVPHFLPSMINVEVLNGISQEQVFRRVSSSDFLIATSPHETQHLASLEAVRLGVPVFITATGVLGFGNSGATPFGYVSTRDTFIQDFEVFLARLDEFRPKEWISRLWSDSEEPLFGLVTEMLENSFEKPKSDVWIVSFYSRLASFSRMQFRNFIRKNLIPGLMRFRTLFIPNK